MTVSKFFPISKLITATVVSSISIFLFALTAFGADYYVSNGGNDSNPGSLSLPFKTIQKALDRTSPGDTVSIRGGTYKEKVSVNISGTNGNPITIKNYENERVILDGNGVSGSYMVYIYNKNYITIKGLEICNSSSGDTPIGIFIEGYGDGIKVLNNKVYAIKSTDNAHGIAAYGTNGTKSINNILIQGNEVYNCILGSSEALVVNGNVENFKILNNTVHDNDNIGICCIGFEKTAPGNDQARNGLVSDNKVYNITSKYNVAYKGEACSDGIYVDGGKDIVIERNIVYNCDIGIEVASEHLNKIASNMTVKNNLVYGSGLFGLSIGGASSQNGYADNCTFRNNTFYNNTVGINIQKSLTNYIVNNIIYDKDTLCYGKTGTNVFKNNLWYSPNGNNGNLAPFANPKFIDAGSFNFRTLGDSSSRNTGYNEISIDPSEFDLDGNPRICEGTVDIGAYEFKTNTEPTLKPTPALTPSSTPTLKPTPTLAPSPTPTLKPTPMLTPSTTPTLKPTPVLTPSPTPTLTPSSTPTLKPTPALTPSTTPTLKPTPALTPSPTPTLKPTPVLTPSPTPTLTPSSTGFDDGNKMRNATTININKEYTAAIDVDGDRDWFKFTTSANGVYIIQSFGNTVDTWGELFNSSENSLSNDDDTGINSNFKMSVNLEAGKTYYIYVDGVSKGSYSIRVDLQ